MKGLDCYRQKNACSFAQAHRERNRALSGHPGLKWGFGLGISCVLPGTLKPLAVCPVLVAENTGVAITSLTWASFEPCLEEEEKHF